MNTITEVRYKRSRQRERILDTLKNTKSHPTASWVYDQLKKDFPSLSLGTVYRNLGILRDQGLVRVLQSGSTFDRFDADMKEHSHFVCENCGKIEDVDLPPYNEWGKSISASLGRKVSGYRLDFYGHCDDCETQEPHPAHSATF
jgi:Fur family peroxide stress response transcriptional regulator